MIPQQDMAAYLKTFVSVKPQTITSTTDVDGIVIDRLDATSGMAMSAQIWAFVDSVSASDTLDVSLRHSDNSDGSSSAAFTDGGGDGALTQFVAADDDKHYRENIDLTSAKRYLFVRATAGGSSISIPCCAGLTLSGYQRPPVGLT